MARPNTTCKKVERGIQQVTRTYDDGRVIVRHRIKYANQRGVIEHRTVASHRVKDARDALAEARAAVLTGQHVTANDSNARFLDVANQWLDVKQADWKPRTYRSCQWTVDSKLAPLHNLRMCDLDYHRVTKFRASLSKPNAKGDRPAPSSIKRTMWVLHAICEHARKRKLILENPCQALDRIKGRRPAKRMPSTEDVERLIARLASPPTDPRWALLVETAAYSGLRAGELAALQVRDLNSFNRSLRVERTIIELPGKYEEGGGLRLDTPKSEAGTRTVSGLDFDLVDRLRVHCSGLGRRDYVFGDRGPDGKPRPLNHGNFYKRVVGPAAEALGIEMTFHGLRHHYASLLIDLGLSPVEVAAQLGHESAAFTLRTYVHLFKKDTTDVGAAISRRRAAARSAGEKITPLRSVPAP